MTVFTAVSWGLIDICSITVIFIFIKIRYQNRYYVTAYLYLSNQLYLFFSHCITCMVSLYTYYFLENHYHFDEQYMGGIILTLFFLISGIGGNYFYRFILQKKESRYNPSQEEYLVITCAAFFAVTVKLISEGIIGCMVPFALLLGRFIWLDTRSFKEIKVAITVKHQRIAESAILLSVGMLILSVVMSVFNLSRAAQPLIAVLCGVIIMCPVEKIISYGYKAKQHMSIKKNR